MERLTRFVLAHRRVIGLIWIVLTVVGIATASRATKAMDQKFTTPGHEGYETNSQIAKNFKGTGGETAPLVAVVKLPGDKPAADPAVRDQLGTLEKTLATAVPGGRVAGYASTGSKTFLSSDGHTAFVVAYPPVDPTSPFGGNPDAAKHARDAMKGVTVAGAPVHLTGYEALAAQSGDSNGPGVLLEALLGGVGALVVLTFVFGSFLAIVPLLMALPAIMTTFLTILGLTTFIEVSPIVAVPGGVDRAGRRDRLRAHRGGAMAGGTCQRLRR